LVVALSLAVVFASAQELATSALNGHVADPSGAVVRGASVSLVRSATGVSRSSQTDAAGSFVFTNLAPGEYEVVVQAGGFASYRAPVNLVVGRQEELRIGLDVESKKTTIVIDDSDAIAPINTTTSVVDGVVSSRQIDSLPLNGRNFLELALLIPGNTMAPSFDPTKANTVVISSAGQLGRGGSVTLDGNDDNDDAVGGMLLNLPEDAVQEFQIATNRFSAEVGRSGSAVANVVTKSGTNALHGSASVYARDKSLQALPPLFNPSVTPGETPPFSRQQYSGTLGGPLVKDRAWLFGAFEYRNELSGVLAGTRDVTNQTITDSFARAPLNDALGTIRGDYQASSKDLLTFRYSIEQLEATSSSALTTALGSASQRQNLQNHFQDFLSSWTHVISPSLLNRFSFSVNKFYNTTDPVSAGAQLDFPSLTDGASYRMPQQTWQTRLQWSDGMDWTHGSHTLRFGGEFQRIMDKFYLGVFQGGRVEFVQDFANQDRNGDGIINDEDLLFAATIRSGNPSQALVLPNMDNNFIAAYIQDDWRIRRHLTLNLGLRYEIDTDVNNVGHYDQINPILAPFFQGTRHKDGNNFGPRIGFNWANQGATVSVHGGYGMYYDRVTLEIASLERGLDGRSLPIEVKAGNAVTDNGVPVYLDQNGNFSTSCIPTCTPTFSNPFIGFIFPGAGAAEGIDIINNRLQNPMVQQFNLGVQWEFAHNWILKADGIHNLGTHFIIGVPVGSVFNPDVGGPEGVTELRSAVNTHYDALWLTVDRRFAKRYQLHSAYTLSKSLNYANDDQIPFAYPPLDPNNLRTEYGPSPNDQRHRFVFSGIADLPWGFQVAPLWTWASGVPMDILLGDGNGSRVPEFTRNAGGRFFQSAAQLNSYITQLNAQGAVNGALGNPLPLVDNNARFNDTFNSFDLRISKDIRIRESMSLKLMGEVFNLFNKTNILGSSTTNYSGYFNALVPDQNDPMHSSAFGKPVSTAGGIFGSGGPRAFQLAAKFSF
jgi:hypothetical protein